MTVVPANRALFWTTYALGTLGPVIGAGAFFPSHHRSFDDRAFLLSWLCWVFGAGALIACVWSVRSILLGYGKARSPVWLYHLVAWLAFLEAFIWVYTFSRVI